MVQILYMEGIVRKELLDELDRRLEGFTNALSFVGLWALARKYVEQWVFWIIVDVVCSYLYIGKGIPFKAGLYGLYVVIAVAGYFKWKKESISKKSSNFAVKS